MPKTISTIMSTKLAQKRGIEPVLVLEVTWTNGGNEHYYATKSTTAIENVRTGILKFGTIESVVKIDQQGQSQAINVQLSDTDGHLKTIIADNNIHGNTVSVYQWESSLPFSEKFLLMQGEVNGPIEWNEEDRTLGFEVITKLADNEIGFSLEQGDFNDVPKELAGKAWPVVFGNVQNVPAIPLQDIPRSSIQEPVGVMDPTLFDRMNELADIMARSLAMFWYYIYASLQATHSGQESYADQWAATAAQAMAQYSQAKAERLELWSEQLLQAQEQKDEIQLASGDGDKYPQGQTLQIQIDDYVFNGYFDGDTFKIQSRADNNYVASQWRETSTSGYSYPNAYGFKFVQAGSTLRVLTDDKTSYVANLLPSNTSSIVVRAWRGVNGNRYLTVVDPSLYTVRLTTLGSVTATIIEFATPLSTTNVEWENDIYVTQTSSVGPNTVDCIEWLIDTFTDLSKDVTSFAAVRIAIDNYPSHFAVTQQYNVLDLIEDICFQARCAAFVSNNTVYLKYLAQEDSATSTFTDADVKSVRLLSTPMEDVVTKLVATWSDDLAMEEPHKYVLRHNVPTYGLREREISFFIYNIPELVLKSATFWLIRMSNIWKRAKFKTKLHKLAVETFDTVSLNMTDDLFGTGNVKAMVTDLTYTPGKQDLDVECWVPVKFGEMTPYLFAWPKLADMTTLFPSTAEIPVAGSVSPQKDVEGDLDFDFSGTGMSVSSSRSSSGSRRQRKDWGDNKPSDLDDTKPSPRFTQSSGWGTGVDPSRDYEYGAYGLVAVDGSTSGETGNAYPGIVASQESDTLYNVDLYPAGLGNDPERVQAYQLQIADGEAVPSGTAVIVVESTWDKIVDGKPVEQNAYYMQVPVWLTPPEAS